MRVTILLILFIAFSISCKRSYRGTQNNNTPERTDKIGVEVYGSMFFTYFFLFIPIISSVDPKYVWDNLLEESRDSIPAGEAKH